MLTRLTLLVLPFSAGARTLCMFGTTTFPFATHCCCHGNFNGSASDCFPREITGINKFTNGLSHVSAYFSATSRRCCRFFTTPPNP